MVSSSGNMDIFLFQMNKSSLQAKSVWVIAGKGASQGPTEQHRNAKPEQGHFLERGHVRAQSRLANTHTSPIKGQLFRDILVCLKFLKTIHSSIRVYKPSKAVYILSLWLLYLRSRLC